jgi:hypothetical protein
MKKIVILSILICLSMVKVALAGTILTIADFSCVNSTAVAVPLNTGQVCAILTNNSGSNDMRVGDQNTGVSRASRVPPNGSITLCTTAAIYCYSASGAAMGITLLMK